MNKITEAIHTAKWFSALGMYVPQTGQKALRSLVAWDNDVFLPDVAKADARIAEEMIWLPSSRDETDPIHGTSLQQTGRTEAQQEELALTYSLALRSLRGVSDKLICSGPHDFTQAAVGSALYCVRMSVFEMQNGCEGFWLDALLIYQKGNWPCGRLPDGELIVY
jgi:hypothetical protein